MLLEAEIIDSVFYVCHRDYIYIYIFVFKPPSGSMFDSQSGSHDVTV